MGEKQRNSYLPCFFYFGMTCKATAMILYDEILNALFLFTLGTIYGFLILSQNNTERILYMLHILEPLIAVLAYCKFVTQNPCLISPLELPLLDFSIYFSTQCLSVNMNRNSLALVVLGSASNSSNFN